MREGRNFETGPIISNTAAQLVRISVKRSCLWQLGGTLCALTRWGAHFWWDQHCLRGTAEREQWKNTEQGCVWEKECLCQDVSISWSDFEDHQHLNCPYTHSPLFVSWTGCSADRSDKQVRQLRTLICKLNMRSQTHQPPHKPCQNGRGEVNLAITGELWGIIKVHWLQRTPAAGRAKAKMSSHLAQKRGRTTQDVPPASALSFFTHHGPT